MTHYKVEDWIPCNLTFEVVWGCSGLGPKLTMECNCLQTRQQSSTACDGRRRIIKSYGKHGLLMNRLTFRVTTFFQSEHCRTLLLGSNSIVTSKVE